MALRIVSWRGNENRVSPPQPPSSASAASVVAIDSLPAPQKPPMMSQAGTEAPIPGGLEADPTGVPAAGIANPTTDESTPRHDTYFFRDGNITFLVRKNSLMCAGNPLTRLQVDGLLYCVHRYFFSRDSVYFSTKFTQLGVRDHEPLRTVVSLGDVERKDFEAFLSVIYPE